MRYIEFGKDKDKVSELVMGLMRIADMNVQDITNLIQTGLEQGINFLDTADCYANGRAEELLGNAFTENPGLRDKVFCSQSAVSAVMKISLGLISRRITFWRLWTEA